MVRYSEILDAYQRIKENIHYTPVFSSRTLNAILQADCFLKCENFQRSGSFKFRGVCNKLSRLEGPAKSRGVVTHSSGNHGQALALAGSEYKIKVTVVMPENAPEIKVNAVKGYGAEIIRCGNSMESRHSVSRKLIDQYGFSLIHGYDDDDIIAGAGTAALELFQQYSPLDYLFCPVGGGGLLGGSSIAASGAGNGCRVIGVEPELADDAFRSLQDGRLYPSKYPETVADGLRTGLSQRTFNILRQKVDRVVRVSDREILEAMRFLWERMKLVVEPSGATALAGVFRQKNNLADSRTGIVVSGGNLDLDEVFTRYEK
jgi:threonine dehydratase